MARQRRFQQISRVVLEGPGIRAAELLFVLLPATALIVSHSPSAPLLGHGKAVAAVALGSNQIVQLEGPVLPAGKGAESIEDQVLDGGPGSSSVAEAFVKEQAMASEVLSEELNR